MNGDGRAEVAVGVRQPGRDDRNRCGRAAQKGASRPTAA
ncbi:hypothetical protein [Streptomyces sp. KL116D]